MDQKRSASHRAKIKNSALYRSQDGLLNSQVEDGRAIDALSAPSGFRAKSALLPGDKTVGMHSPAGLGASNTNGTIMDTWPPLRLNMKCKRKLEALEREEKKTHLLVGEGELERDTGGSRNYTIHALQSSTDQIWGSTSSTLVDSADFMGHQEDGSNTTARSPSSSSTKGPSAAWALLSKCQELTARVSDLEEKEKVWIGQRERLQSRVDTLEVEVAEWQRVASRLEKLEDSVSALEAAGKDGLFVCGEETQQEIFELM